jgi:uncharacterized LabA/DUF88 family protein
MQLLPRPQRYNAPVSKLNSEASFQESHLRVVDKSDSHTNRKKRYQEGGEKVAIFIDGANLFYAAMHLGIEIDYSKLLQHLTKERHLLRAYFYTAVDSTNDKQQGFLLWMRRNGYRVVSKELNHLPDGSKKGNLDVEIAVDMLTLARYCDSIILLSGHGDLAYAVDTVTYLGVQVELVGLGSMTSESLINVADCYTDLELIRENIQKF